MNGTGILLQNKNGFKYNLDGIYVNETGTRRYTFDSVNRTAISEIYNSNSGTWGTDSSTDEYKYALVNDVYFMYTDDGEAYRFEVSEDKNTINDDGTIYIKQAN